MTIAIARLFAYLLVLARVSGFLAMVPIPGVRNGPEPVRVILAVVLAILLWGRASAPTVTPADAGGFAVLLLSELMLGLVAGVVVSFVLESFQLAAQFMGVQAGFAYASTIDPATQADSQVLLVFAQLVSGILFFSLGLDRQIIAALALSLERVPTGTFQATAALAHPVIALGSEMFLIGFRLALPVLALLLLMDLAIALAGKIHSQLQIVSLAFSVKLLAAIVALAAVLAFSPRLLQNAAKPGFRLLTSLSH